MRNWIDLLERVLDPSADIAAVKAYADAHGVALELEQEGNTLYLISIARKNGKAGAGRAVMEKICELADAWQWETCLAVKGSEPKLIFYYQQFGFNHGMMDDEWAEFITDFQNDEYYGDEVQMWRDPR